MAASSVELKITITSEDEGTVLIIDNDEITDECSKTFQSKADAKTYLIKILDRIRSDHQEYNVNLEVLFEVWNSDHTISYVDSEWIIYTHETLEHYDLDNTENKWNAVNVWIQKEDEEAKPVCEIQIFM